MVIFNVTSIKPTFALLLTLSIGLNSVARAVELTSKSPAHRVALVELYSSEGCDSCPPADAWLATVGSKVSSDLLIPLALHVDYWDNLVWKDRFGDHVFTLRQRLLADYVNSKVVYTPELFVGGRELRKWSSANEVEHALQRITSQASPVDIVINVAVNNTKGVKSYKLTTSATNNADGDPRQLQNAYVAIYQNKLISKVLAGENGGITLRHEYVVRRWFGPFPLKEGFVEIQQNITLDSFGDNVPASQFGLVTFVQNATSGEVLQASRLALGL